MAANPAAHLEQRCSCCSDDLGESGRSWTYPKLGASAPLTIHLCAECAKRPIQVCAACQQLAPAPGEALCDVCLAALA